MYGGRGVIWKKTTVDEARSLDILSLQRMGLFDQGQGLIWTISWKSGEEVTSRINCGLEGSLSRPSALRLSYVITDGGESRRNMTTAYASILRRVTLEAPGGGSSVLWRWKAGHVGADAASCTCLPGRSILAAGSVISSLMKAARSTEINSTKASRNPSRYLEQMEERLARACSPDAVSRAMQRIEAAQETIRRSNQAFIVKARKGGLKNDQ